MTQEEKINDIQKRVKRIEILHAIQAGVIILGFIGILSLADLLKKVKTKLG